MEKDPTMDVAQYIESNPKIMLGKPVIKGTRITVELILTKLADGFTARDILEMYPNLKEEDIKACITYAAQILQSEQIIQAT